MRREKLLYFRVLGFYFIKSILLLLLLLLLLALELLKRFQIAVIFIYKIPFLSIELEAK